MTRNIFFIPKKMKIKHGETVLRINISFAAVVTFMLILDESGFCALSLFCCIIHEAGHIICLALLGEKPALLELSFYGIKLERKRDWGFGTEDIIVFLSGPAANFVLSAVLLFFSKGKGTASQVAAMSATVGAFNLIPCCPLDGGNIVYAVLCRNMNEKNAAKISLMISAAVIFPMVFAGLAFTVRFGNFTLLVAAFYLAAMAFLNKKEKNRLKM